MINHNTSQMVLTNTMKKDNQFALYFNGFVFGKKNERINWRKIAAVDVDRISREVDVDVLQDNIEQLTFCNIDNEIDSRMIDPNFLKLFKMSQLTIEYLLECQRQLVEYVSSNKSQVDESYSEINELKKINEVLQKDLTELKKENKRRKKMIEIQQNMINSNSANYHRCAYCSKAFLNVSYLQAHISRRHGQMAVQQSKISPEIELELDKIKEKLRETENQLSQERNARFNSNNSDSFKDNNVMKKFEEWKETQKKIHSDDMKMMEEKFLKEIEDLRIKNIYSEKALFEFEKKLGKQSNVGNLEDEVDEAFIKQQQEYGKLKTKLESSKADFSKNFEEINSKWRHKIDKNKEKFEKELDEKNLMIEKLTEKLHAKKRDSMKLSHTKETHQEIQPPPITPRISRSPSPTKLVPQTIISNISSRSSFNGEMYLAEYCPLTKSELKSNPNMISMLKSTVRKMFDSQLDDIGIYPEDKVLTANDFKMKMNDLNAYRKNMNDDIKPYFNQMRKTLIDLCDEHTKKKLVSSLKSSSEYRVKFQKDPIKYDNNGQPPSKRPNIISNKILESISHEDKSSSENSDISVPNAVESNDDDTEPTKPFSNPIINSVLSNSKQNANNRNNPKPQTIQSKPYYNDPEEDDISDLEMNTTPQNNGNNKNITRLTNNNGNSGQSNVKKNIGLIEKQLVDIKNRGTKPSSNAIQTGFKENDDMSYASVSPLEVSEEEKLPKYKTIQNQPSLDTSTNTSIWASLSHGVPQINGRNSASAHGERPATGNSIQTSNYDSDDYLE